MVGLMVNQIFLVNSGKWYAECRVNAWQANNYVRIGVYARPARTYDEYFC